MIGDKILQSFAKILSHICRNVGFCVRYGGEEFAIILPCHTLEKACSIAEKIRIITELMKIKQHNQGVFVAQLTTSLSVALYNCGESASAFIERTDGALYKAKEEGRNRVIS